MDLWAELYLLDRGERLGKTITGFRNEYFTPGWGNGMVTYKWNPRPNAMKQITDAIADITMSMKASDYLELPDQIDTEIEVTMSDKAFKEYKQFERDSLIEINDEQVVALDAAAAMNKLLQLANGFIYDADKNVHRIHDQKAQALDEIIEQAGEPVLVFYNFQADKDLLLERYNARMLVSDKDIKDWNEGRIKVLLAHPASVGYGLNLQDGGHIIVWYGLTWSLELYQQANARLHRQGQTKPVLVYHLLTAGTVDSEVLAKLKAKDITQSALLEILKCRREM